MTSSLTAADPGARLPPATRATAVAFIGSGVAFSSWASRIPQVRDQLSLDSADLGLVLLAIAAGSVLALPLSGPVIARWGARRTTAAMALLLALSLAGVAVGHRYGVAPLVAALFVLGFANGAWDVGMNVHGALVEQRLGRAIMPRFHAGYSVGTVAGALIGTAMVALGVPVGVHLMAVAVVVGVVVPLWVRRFLPHEPQPHSTTGRARSSLAAWAEPRTVLVGLFVLAFAFTEGTANDWLSVAVIDGYAAPPAIGTLAFAAFLAAMTAGRWFGPSALDRYGRVPVVRGLAGVGVAGLLLFVFGPGVPSALVGVVLWGVGASLGFPVGMSAGSDDPAHAAARVSVIASIGYCAFLGGPPLIGLLGQHLSVLRALTAVVVLLGVATAIAPVLRSPGADRSQA